MRILLSVGGVCLLLLLGGAAFHERQTIQLRQYVAARTPRGIYGFEPGCEVRLLKLADDRQTMTVCDGRQTINLNRALLTNNPDVAAAVREADQLAQAAIFDDQMCRRLAYDASHRDVFIAHAGSVHAAELERVRGAAIGGGHGVLDAPAQPVGADGDGMAPADGNPRSPDDDDALYSAVSRLSTNPRGMLGGAR